MRKTTSVFALSKMKYEMERRWKLSSDIFADSNGAKLIFLLLAKRNNENCLQGYIQRINYDPFGVLMISHLQVTIFCLIITFSIRIRFFFKRNFVII